MIKSKFKRVTSLFLATLMCVTTFAGIGSTTAYAASGEKADVYMVDFPRDGDANYDGVWGHSNLTLKNGWHTGRSNFTNLKAIGSYSGNVAYCIEPGISLKVGQTMNKYDENYFNNLAANGVISGDEIRLFVGRILQYGYRGAISTSWRSQNEAAANSIAQAYATQLLIWETVIGERDANFNHVAASGCSNVKDVINAKHPLRNKIFSYYNSMVQSVQNHATIPSFCNKSSGSAKTIELEWNGSKYTTTLTDSNNVLSKYNFKASISGVSFSVNGNKLTVSMDTAPSKEFTITATKKNAVRRGVVVWSEGKHGQNSSVQDVVSYAQEVSDSINGYVKMKVSYGSCQIVKTSEDGKVDGINFTITGNGINQTVTTANGGKFQIDNLMPGIYTVTEQAYDKYEPQETHRVTVVAGQVAKVNFNNKLKRGDLQVVKSSEDNLVEGVKFHLFGTSLSGDAVDQYAVTDKDGVATFKDVLISGSEPYILEEVDTAIRYVVPKNQIAPVKWKEVTTRNFNNILKKFTVTVTKSDAEKGEAQGNAKLSGAVYGIYKGETLGVVGESGCGKSTTGRLVLHLLEPTEGTVTFDGQDLSQLKKREMRTMRKRMQIIFQDPYASLDPRKTVFQILEEPYRIHHPEMSREEIYTQVERLIACVGLRPEHITRYPHEFSGGQRQRVGIARAIALNPEFVVCDEPVSALDVSIQAQVINLMQDIKKEFSLTYMFISHDLRIIKHFCDRVMVMYLGNIVEIGTKDAIYEKRRHPYTQALLSAIPNIRKQENEHRILLTGDIPSPVNPPSGCPFHPRCRYCMDICKKEKPQLKTMADGTQVACHLNIE